MTGHEFAVDGQPRPWAPAREESSGVRAPEAAWSDVGAIILAYELEVLARLSLKQAMALYRGTAEA